METLRRPLKDHVYDYISGAVLTPASFRPATG